MKFPVLFLLPLIVVVGLISANAVPVYSSSAKKNITPDIVPNMLIVKFRHEPRLLSGVAATGVSSVDNVLRRVMTTRVESLSPSNSLKKSTLPEAGSLARIVIIHYTSPVDPASLAKEISADAAVEYAEPMLNFRPLYTPNDPRLLQQWAIAAMYMAEAWDITKGDSSIVIGFVDSGVNYNHEDLAQSIWINPGEWGTNGELQDNGIDDDGNGYVDDWRGWDFVGTGSIQEPIPDNDPMDFSGHGTHGASIAAARTDNGLGIAGVGYHTKILPVKVQDDAALSGMSGYEGIIYAVDLGCKVINCGWGADGFISSSMQDIINYAYANGALVVGSAGNSVIDSDMRPFMPSSLRHVLSVSSQEPDGSASDWAAYGASVQVFAPGKDVLAAGSSSDYQSVTGTSFAAPMMSGLAALIFSIHPDWTPDQVMKQIRVTTESFGATRNPDFYGRPNALKALSMNQTLSDIPGLMVTATTVTTNQGDIFTEPGQTAQISVELTNVLAPTSAAASLSLFVKGVGATIANPTHSIGVLATNAKKTINFSVTLGDNPEFSEGYLPVVLTFTDGEYTDFDVVRVDVFLTNEWHTTLGLRNVFHSIDMPNRHTIWISGGNALSGVEARDVALRSTDGGDSWMLASEAGFPGSKGVSCIEGIDNNRALAGTSPVDGNAEIYHTIDGGATWAGTSVVSITPSVNCIHMFDASNGIFQGDPKNGVWGIGNTTDGGQTWTPATTPLSAPTGEAGWSNACDFIGDTGWFGTNNSRIYKTTDRGVSWTSYSTPSQHSVNISFRDLNVGVIRFIRHQDTGDDTFAITADGGATWTSINTIDVDAGTMFFERGGKRLWYLRESNAYVSTDLGATWNVRPAPPGMDLVSDADMWTDASQTIAVAAGLEVYRFSAPFEAATSATTAWAAPVGIEINQLYPNPVTTSDAATVRFSTQRSQPITLGLYDINGKLLQTIVDAKLEVGTHSARLATTKLAAGSYIVRLSTGTATVSSKLTIVR